jgi:hypothetical protein
MRAFPNLSLYPFMNLHGSPLFDIMRWEQQVNKAGFSYKTLGNVANGCNASANG